VNDEETIINYLITLALSEDYYRDFDDKSIAFVDECISLVERKYTGIETLEVT
jgi:hypothetical protein